ncbi:MAG: hypothetical protein KIT14_14130 [bacterium]|nr:hypothetical protein [bacterium]
MALGATLVVWAPVVHSCFYADDIVLLYDARNGAPLEFVLTPYGGHLYWTRNLLFLGIERIFGPDPRPFFTLSLANQLLNVALLFAVLHTWTRRPVLAGFWSTLWGTCPLNMGTLNWFATHGQMMVASLVLALLWRAAVLERRGTIPGARDAWVIVAALVVGATCYGVGVGAAMAFPVAALLLFPRMTSRTRLLVCLPILVVPLLYVVGQQLHALVSVRPTGAQVPGVRLLAYVPDQLILTGHLVAHGFAGLLTGFLAPERDFPPALVVGAGALLGLAVVAGLAAADGPMRRRLVAVILLIGAVCGIIAVGRAHMLWFMGGTFAKVAATPRYQYLGPLFLALLAGLLCAQAAQRRGRAAVGLVAAVLILTIDARAWARTAWHVDTHAWAGREVAGLLQRVRDAAAAVPPGTTVVLPNKRFQSVGPVFSQTPLLFPRAAAAFIAFVDGDVVDGRPVRFAEEDPGIYAALTEQPGKRIAGLLVPATPAP